MSKNLQNNGNDFNWFNNKLSQNGKDTFESENKDFSDLVNETKNISVPQNKSKNEIWYELNSEIQKQKEKRVIFINMSNKRQIYPRCLAVYNCRYIRN